MTVAKSLRRIPERSALAGSLVWLSLLLFRVGDPATEFIARLLLLGTLVVVPLGLSLIEKDDERARFNGLFRPAVYAQPAGALMAVVSLLVPQGTAAALLSSGWLLVTVALSLSGFVRLLSKEGASVEEFSINAGLSYLVVGGGWLVFSRYGFQPLGFGDTIVLLTAVHFHYAGFAAPLLAGLAGRALARSKPKTKRLFTTIVVAVISGMPLVAAGITFSTLLALVGAVVMASGLVLLAVVVCLQIVPRLKRRAARALLIASSVSSIFAMLLACVYAYSVVTKTLMLNIPQMAEFHGVANAFGFSLCGLLAWKVEKQG